MTKIDDKQTSMTVEKPFTKTDWLSQISNTTGVSRKDVDNVLQALPSIISEHLNQGLECSFLQLVKFYPVQKEATPERKGSNPFTGEPITFPAKPAHKIVRIKLLKKGKELANQDS